MFFHVVSLQYTGEGSQHEAVGQTRRIWVLGTEDGSSVDACFLEVPLTDREARCNFSSKQPQYVITCLRDCQNVWTICVACLVSVKGKVGI